MISKVIKIVVLLIFVVLIAIQLFPPNFENPPIKPGDRIEDVENVPTEIRALLKNSCADCHSNETKYPWYSKIAPVSWSMHDHIRMGRADLNFSEWGSYTVKKRNRKLEEICEEVAEGEMPHYQYLWAHWDASVSRSQNQALCDWTEKLIKEKSDQEARH